MKHRRNALLAVAVVVAMVIPMGVVAQPLDPKPAGDAEITLLFTNDLHGRLLTDAAYRGGSAYLAGMVNNIRAEVGEDRVALLDAGDVFFAAPAISQLLMGESTIDIYNLIGYDAAALGNHEFDKGQEVLAARVAQSEFPWLGANVVLEGTEWSLPPWAQAYELLEVGGITLGVLGLAAEETPEVTLLGTTAGLVFKDLTETVLHYYDEVMAQADAMVVLAHMGTADRGPYDGLVTVAEKLIAAGKPVDLMIGGHQHQALFAPLYVGDTAIVQAGFYGRWLGRVDAVVDPSTKILSIVDYELITITGGPSMAALLASLTGMYEDGLISPWGVYRSLAQTLGSALQSFERGRFNASASTVAAFLSQVRALDARRIDSTAADRLISGAESLLRMDMEVAARIAFWAEIVAPIVNEPVGVTYIDLVRVYNNESNMGNIVTDSMLWKADLYDDGELNGSVHVAFTNPGGLRADILIPEGAELPYTVTWGDTFDVLPFGNTLYLMDLTGAQIQELLDQSALLYRGILQTAGATYTWYNDTGTAEATTWGAYDVTIGGEPLDPDTTYRVVTNDFLAGGQDGWVTFAEGTNRWNTYYDMQQGFVEYIQDVLDGVIDADDIVMGRIVRLDSCPIASAIERQLVFQVV